MKNLIKRLNEIDVDGVPRKPTAAMRRGAEAAYLRAVVHGKPDTADLPALAHALAVLELDPEDFADDVRIHKQMQPLQREIGVLQSKLETIQTAMHRTGATRSKMLQQMFSETTRSLKDAEVGLSLKCGRLAVRPRAERG